MADKEWTTDCAVSPDTYIARQLLRLGTAEWLEQKLTELKHAEETQHRLRLRIIKLEGAVQRSITTRVVRVVTTLFGAFMLGYQVGTRWRDAKDLPWWAVTLLVVWAAVLLVWGLYQERGQVRDWARIWHEPSDGSS